MAGHGQRDVAGHVEVAVTDHGQAIVTSHGQAAVTSHRQVKCWQGRVVSGRSSPAAAPLCLWGFEQERTRTRDDRVHPGRVGDTELEKL